MDNKTRAAVKKSIDVLFNTLGHGDRVLISAMQDANIFVERSSDGRELRIVRDETKAEAR